MVNALTIKQRTVNVNALVDAVRRSFPGTEKQCTAYMKEVERLVYEGWFASNGITAYRIKLVDLMFNLEHNARNLFAQHSPVQLVELSPVDLGVGFPKTASKKSAPRLKENPSSLSNNSSTAAASSSSSSPAPATAAGKSAASTRRGKTTNNKQENAMALSK